jgi:hypothetical protein
MTMVQAGDIIGAFGIDHSSAAAGFVATLGAVLCYGEAPARPLYMNPCKSLYMVKLV